MAEVTSNFERPVEGPVRKHRQGLGLRILCVEDDEQVVTVLAELLATQGYSVDVAMTAESGLRKLETGGYHLVIADYWLPDRTGAWMLAEASHKGALRRTQVLVVTAEHHPQGVENLRVLKKPLDLDDFLRVIHDVLAPVRAEELERARQDVENSVVNDAASGVLVELMLYISAASPSSLKALRNLRRLLAEYQGAQVRLTVVDLSKERSTAAEEDRIAFTPTLVKRGPLPKAFILGDLEDATVVEDLLGHCGVERTR